MSASSVDILLPIAGIGTMKILFLIINMLQQLPQAMELIQTGTWILVPLITLLAS
jgi:hypothetical protein